jgi:predicted transcriptional regulator
MIDPETKERIVKLKKMGHTHRKIKEKTGVSLPTIRKIIREADEHEIYNDDYEDIDDLIQVGEPLYSYDVFVINLTTVKSYEGLSVYDILRNGVAIWTLEEQLLKLYPESYAKTIVHGINDNGGVGGIYTVKITKQPTRTEISVFPIASLYS